MADTTPSTTTEPHANPFVAVALLIKSVADSLEGIKSTGQAPRWVRIVRVRQFDSDAIAKGTIAAIGGLATAIAYIHRFTLQARELLIQGDAAKALIEVSADFIKTVATDEFFHALQAGIGMDETGENPLKIVGTGVGYVEKVADKVPSPEDLDVIGKQLYRLLCIEQLPAAETTVPDLHIDIAKTGKLRLIQWGVNKPVPTFLLLKEITSVDISRLGSRRIPATGSPGTKSLGRWAPVPKEGEVINEADKEIVYEIDYSNNSADLGEAGTLLKKLGYMANDAALPTTLDDTLKTTLKLFQKTNRITETGLLDNLTINRLLNLDFDGKGIKKAIAKP